MSEAMAEVKKQELEAFTKLEEALVQEVKEDRCPSCGTPTSKVIYVNPQIVKLFGWIECTTCGCVYSPQSIRKQKAMIGAANVSPEVITP